MDYSFQLYSARNHPDLKALFGKLADIGYTQVEGFGGMYQDPAALAAQLRDAGLAMPTGHFGLDMLEDTSTSMRTAETLGVKVIYCPFLPMDQRTDDDSGWIALGEKLAALNEAYAKAGFEFGWHNHDFEFKPTNSGAFPMDIILNTASELTWEVDIAWIAKSGQFPSEWLRRYGDRVNAVHVKDIAPEGECVDEGGWADVGYGTLDWADLLKVARSETGARYYVMEHDNPSDVERFAVRSFESVKKIEA